MLKLGQTFSRYVIEESIGQGGMGEVYRAFDEKLRRKVALKVIHPDLAVPDAAARLVREARVAAGLAHPNVVAIFDLGEIDDTVFLVMELVSGAPLRAYIGDRSVPVARKIRWLAGIARGLAAAHKGGLVHRDVKPANVMVSDDDVVKVLDFGLAKPLEAASFRSDVGMVVGTPGYLAPELFTGATADARSDQFAFGVTAYELLAGVHPGNPMGAVPAALDLRTPEVGPAVARIIARTLSRAASDRYANLSEVASALEAELGGARSSAAAEASPPTRREGPPAAPNAALAHAATELATTGATKPLEGARKRNVARILAIVGLLVIGGAYVAMRVVAEHGSTGPTVIPSATAPIPSASDGASDASSAPDADAAILELVDDDARDAASDAPDDADASDGDADAGEPRPGIRLDDFPDPWKKGR
ncbi:MAG TPA: serine/threonine-protein kinase [Labilithrix sp.]|nr:serine/threonine-protein kinase [Labilithrix sp.]